MEKNRKNTRQAYNYIVTTDGSLFNQKVLDKLKIATMTANVFGGKYMFPLHQSSLPKLGLKNVTSVEKYIAPKGTYDPSIFPHSPKFSWNVDNLGPLEI
jgi:signal peptidase I